MPTHINQPTNIIPRQQNLADFAGIIHESKQILRISGFYTNINHSNYIANMSGAAEASLVLGLISEGWVQGSGITIA